MLICFTLSCDILETTIADSKKLINTRRLLKHLNSPFELIRITADYFKKTADFVGYKIF